MSAGFNWSAGQHIGRRQKQEDFFAVLSIADGCAVLHYKEVVTEFDVAATARPQAVLILADGMGGMGHGDAAASATVEAFAREYRCLASQPTERALKGATHAANQALARMIECSPDYDRMGCTLVAVGIDRASRAMHWLSVGDSLLYVYRGGELLRLNVAHNAQWLTELIEAEHIASGQLTTGLQHLNPPSLVSTISGDDIAFIDCSDEPVFIEPGDAVLLASDGIETLAELELRLRMKLSRRPYPATGQDDREVCDRLDAVKDDLLKAVAAAGNPYQDNVTVMLAQIAEEQIGDS